MLKRPRDPALEVFDQGCLVLRRNGEVAGHVATTLGFFWSPGHPFTMQQWVWYIVVWADGDRERPQEDYPPWMAVREIQRGVFVWDGDGPRSSEYDAEWLSASDARAMWDALGVTIKDF